MTIPKNKRRTITVDSEKYHWVVQFERSGHIVIQHASGRGSHMIVDPHAIMRPRHIAAAIQFARDAGWKSGVAGEDFWLGFELKGDQPAFRRIPARTESHYDRGVGRWVLPPAIE